MSWFDRFRRKRPEPMSGWCVLSDELADRLVVSVTREVLRVAPGEYTESNASKGTIGLPNRGLRLELAELANRCSTLDPLAWDGPIANQVASWLPPPPELPTTLAAAAPVLRVRFGGVLDPETFSRELATDLVGELCFDLPGRVATVARSVATAWQTSESDLWQLGIGNLAASDATLTTLQLDQPIPLVFYRAHGDSTFIASLALRISEALADLDAASPKFGWLFMVPTRQSLWFAPIEQLVDCAAGMMIYDRGGQELLGGLLPLSAQIYWTDGTNITAISREGVKTGSDLTAAITAVVKQRCLD
jgi:hypothetical protein